MALIFTWTTAGRERLVNAQNNGVAALVIARIGLSSLHTADGWADLEALPGEFKQLVTTGSGVVEETLIHVTIQDTSTDAYDWRAFGLYSDDDVLLGVYSQAAPIFIKSPSVILAHAIDITLVDAIDPGSIDFGEPNFILPPATTERLGLVELATPAEAAAGTDLTRAVTPAGLKAALSPLQIAQRRGAIRAFFLAASA